MEIRKIKLAEAELVIGLFDKYRSFYEQAPDEALAADYINARLSNNESVIFVALEDAISAGFTQLYPKYSSVSANKNWILNDLYVDNSFRKKGIGEALVKAAMDFAKSEGATYVQLETAVDNYTAQRLYDTIGFTKQEAESGHLFYRIGL